MNIESSLGHRLSNWKRVSRAISTGVRFNQIECDTTGDRNSCTVVALSNVAQISFGKAQRIAAAAGRKPNKGFNTATLVAHAQTVGFNFAKVEGVTKASRISVKRFLADYPKGRFIVRISGHAFTVIDGAVEDRAQPKPLCRIKDAWELIGAAAKPVYANPY